MRTDAFARLVAAALAGDVATASALGHDLLSIVDAGFAEPSPAVWKAALHAMGRISTPNVRALLQPASPDATSALFAASSAIAA